MITNIIINNLEFNNNRVNNYKLFMRNKIMKQSKKIRN